MKAIFSFIHAAIQVIITLVAFAVIDLPLKILSTVFLTAASVVIYLLYPITKRIPCPKWIKDWIDYATSVHTFIATWVCNMWN